MGGPSPRGQGSRWSGRPPSPADIPATSSSRTRLSPSLGQSNREIERSVAFRVIPRHEGGIILPAEFTGHSVRRRTGDRRAARTGPRTSRNCPCSDGPRLTNAELGVDASSQVCGDGGCGGTSKAWSTQRRRAVPGISKSRSHDGNSTAGRSHHDIHACYSCQKPLHSVLPANPALVAVSSAAYVSSRRYL